MPAVVLARDLARHLRLGHPWIYLQALAGVPSGLASGAIVDVVDGQRQFVARGFYDPGGPIAVRVLTLDEGEAIDADFIAARVASACAVRRAARHLIDSDALRLLHGEADRLPGLVLDCYGTAGVMRFDGAAAEAAWRPHVAAVVAAAEAGGFPLAQVWARGAEGRRGPGSALVGPAPTVPVTMREGAARYEVDLVAGQKTGFFLDQRENRRLVGSLADGAAVLNLYGYTGGFSVSAALGGARHVTTVDLAGPAIAAATRNFALSGVTSTPHEPVVGDVFEYLAAARARGQLWDIVVCDPPSFAPSERALPQALAAYRRLHRAAAEVVAQGGLLAVASCSSHLRERDFHQTIADGLAAAGRIGKLVTVGGAGPDHPVVPAFPEGRYLKFALLALA